MKYHLYEGTTNFENIIFLKLSSNYAIQIFLHVLKNTIEVAFVFGDFFDIGDLFDLTVVHQ
jgi:hypothetical protein